MTTPCPRGPRYRSRTAAKAARKGMRDPNAVRPAECGLCGGHHLVPNLTSRTWETWT